MLHPDLQQLLDLALQDEGITPRKKELLHRKARALGQDVDELDRIIESIIKKNSTQSELRERGSNSCPNCGALIDSNHARCSSCGVDTKEINANPKIINEIIAKWQKIEQEWNTEMEKMTGSQMIKGVFMGSKLLDGFAQKKLTLISTIVVPNDKISLREFFSFCDANAEAYFKLSNTGENYLREQHKKVAQAWVGKASISYSKLKRFANSDSEIKGFLSKFDKKYSVSNIKNQAKAFQGPRFNLTDFLKRVSKNPLMWFPLVAILFFFLMFLIAKLM